jgi:hypothetical protein
MTADALTPARPTCRSASSAHRFLWLAVFFDVMAFGVGFGWDRRWHATHPFEDFFSPAHPIFGAIAAMLTFAIGAWLADRVWMVVAEPERRRVLTFVVVAGLLAPAATGALDLSLRGRVP